MSADTNKKSARTFQCREALWSAFEQMARELECSVDYLINEAMKQYVRQRSLGTQRTPYPAPGRPADSPTERAPPGSPAPSLTSAPPAMRPASLGSPLPVPPGIRPSSPLVPPPAISSLPVRTPMPMPAPMPPPPGRGVGLAPMPSVARSGPPSTRTVPPPLPRTGGNGLPATAASTLSLFYQGERVTVTKERFVIGRGKQASDLTLKDPNVSRQHAMIEHKNGVYFMVDMGSTNGVEFNGQRIARKPIAEGDIFRICDHEITFTYR